MCIKRDSLALRLNNLDTGMEPTAEESSLLDFLSDDDGSECDGTESLLLDEDELLGLVIENEEKGRVDLDSDKSELDNSLLQVGKEPVVEESNEKRSDEDKGIKQHVGTVKRKTIKLDVPSKFGALPSLPCGRNSVMKRERKYRYSGMPYYNNNHQTSCTQPQSQRQPTLLLDVKAQSCRPVKPRLNSNTSWASSSCVNSVTLSPTNPPKSIFKGSNSALSRQVSLSNSSSGFRPEQSSGGKARNFSLSHLRRSGELSLSSSSSDIQKGYTYQAHMKKMTFSLSHLRNT